LLAQEATKSVRDLGTLGGPDSIGVVDDAITLAGEEPSRIAAPVRDRAIIVSRAVESSSGRGEMVDGLGGRSIR
jgi:hypothetical protein